MWWENIHEWWEQKKERKMKVYICINYIVSIALVWKALYLHFIFILTTHIKNISIYNTWSGMALFFLFSLFHIYKYKNKTKYMCGCGRNLYRLIWKLHPKYIFILEYNSLTVLQYLYDDDIVKAYLVFFCRNKSIFLRWCTRWWLTPWDQYANPESLLFFKQW